MLCHIDKTHVVEEGWGGRTALRMLAAKKKALLPEVAVVAAVVVGGTENELMKYEHMFVDMSEMS